MPTNDELFMHERRGLILAFLLGLIGLLIAGWILFYSSGSSLERLRTAELLVYICGPIAIVGGFGFLVCEVLIDIEKRRQP